MCIYTVKKQKLKKIYNIPQGAPPNVLKLGVADVDDTAKTNKDLGMLYYIQVDDSVFFAGSSLLNMEKLFSKIFLKYKKNEIFFF